MTMAKEHDCIECLEPDCDCGYAEADCDRCSECNLDADEMEMEESEVEE